jgi:hypothetical protein
MSKIYYIQLYVQSYAYNQLHKFSNVIIIKFQLATSKTFPLYICTTTSVVIQWPWFITLHLPQICQNQYLNNSFKSDRPWSLSHGINGEFYLLILGIVQECKTKEIFLAPNNKNDMATLGWD